MSFQIIESCVNCWACLPLCPCEAIQAANPHFTINEKQCSECDGDYADPQCVSICPVEGAILTQEGLPANPVGSLTGIPPELLEQTMQEMRAR